MADKRPLNDKFARRPAPGAKGFAGTGTKDPFAAKASPPPVDAFANAPKKPAPAARPKDAFAPKSNHQGIAMPPQAKIAAPLSMKPAVLKPALAGAKPAGPAKPRMTQPAPKRASLTAQASPPAEKFIRPKSPALQPASSPPQKSLMVKPTSGASGGAPRSAMVMLGGASLMAPKPRGASKFYNPFDQKTSAPPAVRKAPAASPPRDMFEPIPQPEPAPPPAIAADPEPAPAPQPKRGLHVVQAPERPLSAVAEPAKQRPAARASSLVLVSGAGALTATAEADSPVTEKPPEAAAPAAEPPLSAKSEAEPVKTRSGGGGTGGDGSGNGRSSGASAVVSPRRGLNQDDLFGIVFGIAALIFLLLWFMRGKGEEAAPGDDLLATPQSSTGQALAALPAAPKPDPFGDAPVNLKPSGPTPEAPADIEVAPVAPPAAAPAPATPVAAPPPAAPNPEAALPIAERKMHAWFCTASSRLTKPSRTELTGEMAKFEDVFKGKELIVRGYADTRGSPELNADLGSRRAQTVAEYLTAKGLSVVDVQGVGELEGLDDNQNCPNQRRVDVWVKGGPAETPSRACAPEPEAESLTCG